MKHLKVENRVPTQFKAVPGSGTNNKRQQIARYKEWLSMQSGRNTLTNAFHEINEYAKLAGQTTLVEDRKIEIFAPFRPEHSALWVLKRWQAVALIILLLLWGLGLQFYRQETLLITLTFITLLYFGHLLLTIVLSFFTFLRPAEEEIDADIVEALRHADWPYYTILCPLYREKRVVPQFVRAMQALDYPADKLQILFLTEADDAETRDAIRALSLPPHFKIVTVPDGSPRTKPRACNYGLMQATGQYVVIFDAEDVPEPTQLKKAVLTFANHGAKLACVQAKLNFYNPHQNILTRWFTAEYSLWFDMILPGLQLAKFSLPLGGTSNHFPTAILRALGGWDAFNVTEDCDLGLRLGRYKFETVVLNSTTYEEANSRFKNWIRQRSRWIKGYMQTYLLNMRRPWVYLRPERWREFCSLQLVIGGKTAFLFLNPLLWLLFILYLCLSPFVGGAYHHLFPKPLLYMGSFSLIFGNFFYIYIYLLACFRRKQYRLMKWSLLIPGYWIMMSIAAGMALFQLIVKPHYWEKTEHGLHLDKKEGVPSPGFSAPHPSLAIVDEPTALLRVPTFEGSNMQGPISSITSAFNAISTLPIAAFSRKELTRIQQVKQQDKQAKLWLFATMLTAFIVSITACYYYFQQHEILLYADALSRMMLARRFFDSQSPGFAQLGGVWLPLPQLAMFPFIWNDYLWRTGLAGSFASMTWYLVATCCIFLAARRFTGDNLASFIGTLAFILNPNILYLQSTPLSELSSIATCTMTCYFFLCWAQDNQSQQLVYAAGSAFLATLARYDGIALFFALCVFIVVIGLIRRQSRTIIQSNLFLFGLLGGLGIMLWLLWNQLIFHDFLYFQRGPYSAQGQGADDHISSQPAYHNLWESIRFYFFTSTATIGPILVGLTILAVIIFIARKRLSTTSVALLAYLVPFAFYVLSMYTGQVNILLPGLVPTNSPHFFNVRFGSAMVASSAIGVGILAGYLLKAGTLRWPSIARTGQVVLAAAVIFQAILTATGGIITVQDGLYGKSCALPHAINIYLAQHYNGGKVLEDAFTAKIDGAEADLQLRDVVYEGSGPLWTEALQNPASVVDWIILYPGDAKDLVAQRINVNTPQFQQQFTRVVKESDGLSLYHRNGLPPLPTRAISPDQVNAHKLCKIIPESAHIIHGEAQSALLDRDVTTGSMLPRRQSLYR